MIIPPLLKKGDTVKIISTARKIDRETIDKAQKLLLNRGLNVELGKHLFSEYHQFAGTDKERIADLQEAINRPDVKAVFCARGGYGTIRLIDKVDVASLFRYPKWFVGYSDITVLHYFLHHLQMPSIHATMPVNFQNNTQASLDSLFEILFEGKNTHHIFSSFELNRNGHTSGILVGGNLSIIYSLLGTKYDIHTSGKILFIEDLDEYLYHIDRMMAALYHAGKLHKLAGLIVGGMTDMNDNEVPFGKTAEEIIYDYVKDFDYPVLFYFPAGHINDNRALILGGKYKMEVKNKQEATIEFQGFS